MSEPDALIVDDRSGVRHLILNRPEKINAIDFDQHLRLKENFEKADVDPSVKVLALSGVGRGFCAGDDLASTGISGHDPYKHRRVDLELGSGPSLLLESCGVLRRLSKPTVALMHGIALGSGYDYSLSCDFRVVTADIRYGDPRINLALWAAEGWSYKLPRLVGQSLVSRIAYLGDPMNGERAYEFGLAHRVVSGEPDIIDSSREFLDMLMELSSPAYSNMKKNMLDSLDANFSQSQSMSLTS
ncbi:MAG: enoyl-CoA hydratase/isomerase family protein [Gammaproteobacteria bacterium]|nr:enoyl-CoA hydratase/isomerase family protein [Gammaproteobacteria bacterium]MYD81487.1 enoyl-CoA hydratase/isomerase family protein [Gammaproteobacteria bacterium]